MHMVELSDFFFLDWCLPVVFQGGKLNRTRMDGEIMGGSNDDIEFFAANDGQMLHEKLSKTPVFLGMPILSIIQENPSLTVRVLRLFITVAVPVLLDPEIS